MIVKGKGHFTQSTNKKHASQCVLIVNSRCVYVTLNLQIFIFISQKINKYAVIIRSKVNIIKRHEATFYEMKIHSIKFLLTKDIDLTFSQKNKKNALFQFDQLFS